MAVRRSELVGRRRRMEVEEHLCVTIKLLVLWGNYTFYYIQPFSKLLFTSAIRNLKIL